MREFTEFSQVKVNCQIRSPNITALKTILCTRAKEKYEKTFKLSVYFLILYEILRKSEAFVEFIYTKGLRFDL